MLEVAFFSIDKMFKMAAFLTQYQAWTIFHIFVDVVECIFANGLNALPNLFFSFPMAVGGSQNT